MSKTATGPRSRFDTPSAGLDLGAVAARQTRKIRIISLAVAIALHGSLAIWKVSAERRAVKPLTTRFIKREPRLVKPLELRKAPKPKRRQMRRRMKRVRAKVDTRGISRAPKASQVLDSLVRPVTSVGQAESFERPALEPMIESEKVTAVKTGGRSLNLSLEMVDVSALDTGRDRAFVVQDAADKRGIRGFFHVARTFVHSARFRSKGLLTSGRYQRQGLTPYPMAIPHLAETVNEFTEIHVDVLDDIALDDAKLLGVPWVVYNTTNQFDPSKAELRNLGQYFASGGFVFASGQTGQLQFIDQFFGNALETQGLRRARHWNRVVLQNDHPVYHAFFDFDGPPGGNVPGASNKKAYGNVERGTAGEVRGGTRGTLFPVNYFVRNDGHVMAILEAKGFVRYWERYSHDSGWNFRPADFRDMLTFGVNTVVFALTQEGSLAQRAVATAK